MKKTSAKEKPKPVISRLYNRQIVIKKRQSKRLTKQEGKPVSEAEVMRRALEHFDTCGMHTTGPVGK